MKNNILLNIYSRLRYNIGMKRVILSLALIFLCTYAAYSKDLEIEQTAPLQTIQHVYTIDDEEVTIDNHNGEQSDEDYLKNEVELKGTVIYNEGAKQLEAIELDSNIQKPHINLKTSNMIIPVKDEKIKTIGLERYAKSAISMATRVTGEEYLIKPVWSYIEEQTGNFSYGTIYSSGLDSAQLQTTMNLYTRYDFKHFAITGAVATNESNVEGTKDEKIIQFAPEIKLSKSFVIRDTVQAYVNEDCKKNKISIIYTPQWAKHPDILRFELGFSHTYYGGGRTRSALEFSTRIRF